MPPTTKYSFLIPTLVLVSTLLIRSAVSEYKYLDRKSPVDVPDVNHDEAVQQAGKFAVIEFNKKRVMKFGPTITQLKSHNVAAAWKTQLLSGNMYYLTVTAIDGLYNGTFDGVVFFQPWTKTSKLVSFNIRSYTHLPL